MIKRDFFPTLKATHSLEAVLVWGPRQVGKSTLLELLEPKTVAILDDLQQRTEAQADPAFFLGKQSLPCLIDEIQYAPNLFPELKLRIDASRRTALRQNIAPSATASYYLTGSNRTLLEAATRESLAGRCTLFELHGLSVAELLRYDSSIVLQTILFKGGFPELYRRIDLPVIGYINDYINTFVERDLARGAGIEKLGQFLTVLQLLAARTGQYLVTSELAQAAGVDQKTITSWLNLLQRNFIVSLVPPWSSNLSKRVTKMAKLHFYDTGLCARLQGHQTAETLFNSPHAGSLFESLVFSEIVKTRANFLQSWQLWTWRTKEQHEIDFILQQGERLLFIEVKLGIYGAKDFHLDPVAQKEFREPHQKIVVTAGGGMMPLGPSTMRIPIHDLGAWLLKWASEG
ncbi:MAG: ATP-binding protein [Proteobacteria bacterium]|nr:ATP-binding protein [Pseudomonadota bacterium]